MNTQLLTNSKEDIEAAAGILKEGGLVAIPTETVYGLAADALNPCAVSSIFEAKGRPSDNPLIVHISHVDEIEKYDLVREFPKSARLLAEKFWPGPLTIIMPKSDSVPRETTGGLDSVAIRLPSHPVAREIIKAAGCPLAAPSANLSGSPSPTTAQHVLADMQGRIPAIVEGGSCEVGLESTVITVCTETPTVLRPGKVTLEELRDVLGEVNLSKAVLEELKEGEEAASPGMKYKHYSPKARVFLVKGSDMAFCCYVNTKEPDSTAALCYDSDVTALHCHTLPLGEKEDFDAQAHNLFAALREADEIEGVDTIYVRCPGTDGLSMALFNRLIRAAGFQIITLRGEGYRLIGLTGTTGSGKSEASRVFAQKGFAVVNADEIAHKALTLPECIKKLTDAFGGEILNSDGTVCRKTLGRLAFSSKENTEMLNSITHPIIADLCEEEFDLLCSEGASDIILDAPTLIESGLHKICDRVVSVISEKETRLERIMARDNITKEQALARMNAQQDDEFYKEHSQYVLVNDGCLEAFREKAEELAEELL